MRIINNPNPKEEQMHICEECQCEFAYTEVDKHTVNSGGLGINGHNWYMKFVICPNCGNSCNLNNVLM